MIRKEPKHARQARERLGKIVHALHPKKRKRRKSAKRKRYGPSRKQMAPSWEQAELARLKHDKRVADDLKLNRFFNDVFNASLTDRTMLVGSEINDRGQVVTLAIPMAHLRELCRIMKERVGVVAGSVPTR